MSIFSLFTCFFFFLNKIHLQSWACAEAEKKTHPSLWKLHTKFSFSSLAHFNFYALNEFDMSGKLQGSIHPLQGETLQVKFHFLFAFGWYLLRTMALCSTMSFCHISDKPIVIIKPTLKVLPFSLRSNDMTEKEELQAHEPPASLVPRLHALVIRHIEHNNPSLPSKVDSDSYKQGKLVIIFLKEFL